MQADESGVVEGEHVMSSDAQVQTAHAVSQHKAVQVVAHLSSSKLSVISATSNAAVKRDDVSVPASASVSVTSGDGGARREAAAGEEEKEIDGSVTCIAKLVRQLRTAPGVKFDKQG